MSRGASRSRAESPATSSAIIAFEPRQLAESAAGTLLRVGAMPIVGAAVDTRRMEPGNAFFALPGERTDGHRFLEAAVAAGAAALVVSEPLDADRLQALAGERASLSVVHVADPAVALRAVAAAYRARFDPLVIGITGSLAKTSTKELVAEVLAGRFRVLRSAGNENNEIGLPLTLLRLRPEHEVAVLEMGLYTMGEIALLARLAQPSIGVVTAVRGVHISRAGSIEAIEAGKRELVEALPASGWAVLNADDPRVSGMAGSTPARVVRYGFDAAADVRAEDVRSLAAAGMRFRLRWPEGTCDVTTPALGRHGVHNALAAAAVATCAGLSGEDIASGLARPVHTPHRSQLIRAGGWTILDDSYNASPDAVLAALGLLAELPGRHIAVLGEMLELGDVATAEHHRVGASAASVVDRLVVVGAGAAGIADGARAGGLPSARVDVVADRDEATALLLAELHEGDTVLVKASRGAALDLLVERLVLAAGSREDSA
ncbi:MAG TPA: UDP-N-acetylmuramoyl-tripeptide--D-alanyl-D-alanine ligase [Candidatus Deferrimicrobium sp.]|nr:UDP-N-acetylmuramoyl-tripeptide--D-alanyl-D-alanine ligase [Candidatus Deferrimicrobium sp.]